MAVLIPFSVLMLSASSLLLVVAMVSLLKMFFIDDKEDSCTCRMFLDQDVAGLHCLVNSSKHSLTRVSRSQS